MAQSSNGGSSGDNSGITFHACVAASSNHAAAATPGGGSLNGGPSKSSAGITARAHRSAAHIHSGDSMDQPLPGSNTPMTSVSRPLWLSTAFSGTVVPGFGTPTLSHTPTTIRGGDAFVEARGLPSFYDPMDDVI